jgi:hypothetical protein
VFFNLHQVAVDLRVLRESGYLFEVDALLLQGCGNLSGYRTGDARESHLPANALVAQGPSCRALFTPKLQARHQQGSSHDDHGREGEPTPRVAMASRKRVPPATPSTRDLPLRVSSAATTSWPANGPDDGGCVLRKEAVDEGTVILQDVQLSVALHIGLRLYNADGADGDAGTGEGQRE